MCQSAPSFCGGISISRIWWSPVPTGSQDAWCGKVTAASQRQGQDSLRKAWKRWGKEPTEPHRAACYYECTGGPWNASPRLWNSDIRCKTATANRSVWLSKCMSTWGTLCKLFKILPTECSEQKMDCLEGPWVKRKISATIAPLGTSCHAGHCCVSWVSLLGTNTGCFSPLAAHIGPPGIKKASSQGVGFQIRSSLDLPAPKVHGSSAIRT